MSYSPIFDIIASSIKNVLKWFFATCLFCTVELKTEVETYFRTGQTAFRYFEWLSIAKMQKLYPTRWKIVMADFSLAYLRLCIGGGFLILACFAIMQIIT